MATTHPRQNLTHHLNTTLCAKMDAIKLSFAGMRLSFTNSVCTPLIPYLPAYIKRLGGTFLITPFDSFLFSVFGPNQSLVLVPQALQFTRT